MNAPTTVNNYQLWLSMGHIDDPNFPHCKKCKLSLEAFSALKKSCTEVLEDVEIERKKAEDDEYFAQQRYLYGGL